MGAATTVRSSSTLLIAVMLIFFPSKFLLGYKEGKADGKRVFFDLFSRFFSF